MALGLLILLCCIAPRFVDSAVFYDPGFVDVAVLHGSGFFDSVVLQPWLC